MKISSIAYPLLAVGLVASLALPIHAQSETPAQSPEAAMTPSTPAAPAAPAATAAPAAPAAAPAADPALQGATTLDQLLEQVRTIDARDSKVNADREARFAAARDQQKQLLA